MKRAAIAMGLLAGMTLPALVVAVFFFGCCVLPFHRVMHHLMPICNMAGQLMRGHDGGQQSSPATPASESGKGFQLLRALAPQHHSFAAPDRPRAALASSPALSRSFMTLGALRCDDDIGLQILFTTFRI